MHAAAYAFIAAEVRTLSPRVVLEIGSKNINGSVRPLFQASRYIGIDVAPGHGVDVVASGATYVPPEPPDVVVCCEVFEHAEEAPAICAHVASLLPAGGTFLLTMAGVGRRPHSAIDGGPLRAGEFYRNVTPDDLAEWLPASAWTEVTIQTNPALGDLYARATRG